MTLLEKLEKAKADLTEIKAQAEAGEKTADELADAMDALVEAQKAVDAADEAEELMKSLEVPAEKKADQEEKKMAYKTIGEAVAAQVIERDINPKEKFSFSASLKAAAPMTTPSSISPAITDVDTNIVQKPRRELRRLLKTPTEH